MLASTATRVWLALVTATAVTALIFETSGGVAWATAAILVIAAAKIALIMGWFMEVRSAPVGLRVACALWLAAVLSIVLAGLAAS